MTTRAVRITLTELEADALAGAVSEVLAGEYSETRTGTEVAALLRADLKLNKARLGEST